MPEINQEFYKQDTVEVARRLLGMSLVHHSNGGLVSGIIVETEAYLGTKDKASHAANGPTPRSKIMFGPPGMAYVYFNYGMHHLFNIVTEEEGTAGAVLIRALEPMEGLGLMKQRRKVNNIHQLCSGPGKLTQALGIDLRHNGLKVTRPPVYIANGKRQKFEIAASPRIGIAKEVDKLWRFYIKDNKFVSKTPLGG